GPVVGGHIAQAYPWHFDPMDPTFSQADLVNLDLSLPFRPIPNNNLQVNGYPECYVPKPWMSPNFVEFPKNSGTIYPSFIPYWWQRERGTGHTHEPICI